MHAVVCIKQVPDTSELRINPETGTLIRSGVASIINPHDVHALECALSFKDQHGGSVSVISMGPSSFTQSLRKAISLGADRAFLLSDRAMAAADTFATSRVLAAAIERINAEIEPVDVVVCGKQTIDGDTAQVGPGVAARLQWPVLTAVMNIQRSDFDAREIVVERKMERQRQVVWARLPALLTVEKELNTPRYASLPALVAAARAEITIWNREDLNLPREEVGLVGSPTIVAKSYLPPVQPRQGRIIDGREDPRRAVEELLDLLFAEEAFVETVMHSGKGEG